MKVKAKWNVKDGNGWHSTGEVFETESELGEAVEVLDAPKEPKKAKEAEPAQEPAKEPENAPETETEPVKARSAARRKNRG